MTEDNMIPMEENFDPADIEASKTMAGLAEGLKTIDIIIKTEGHDFVGGITGYNAGTVNSSDAAGIVSSSGDCAGGLVGRNDGDINQSYADCEMLGDDSIAHEKDGICFPVVDEEKERPVISKGTFYYHFGNKESLYLYLLQHSVTAKWQFIKQRSKEEHLSTEMTDIFERFKLQARLGTEFGKLFPKYHRLSIMFAKEKGKIIYEKASEVLEMDSEKILKDMIDKAMIDGDIREDLPAEFIHNIVGYLLRHYTDVFWRDEDLTLDKMLENIDYFVDFLKNGIGRK